VYLCGRTRVKSPCGNVKKEPELPSANLDTHG
jgi:hypothetical protein